MFTLAWIVFLWCYILGVSVSWKTRFNHFTMWSVALVPESTDHTHSTHGLPLNMLNVTASHHIFQYHSQCSLGSMLNIVTLKINCCSRIFHWFNWWVSKKTWKLQLMNRTVFHLISFSFLLSPPLFFFLLEAGKALRIGICTLWSHALTSSFHLWESFSSTSARYGDNKV